VRASARFYRDVVGLEPDGDETEAWAWFWAGERGAPQRVAVARGPLLFEEHSPLPEGERFGRVHFALDVPRERLEAAVENVSRHGIEVYGPKRFDWMSAESWYFYDPDGNLLEFWSPDPGSGTTMSPMDSNEPVS
jgi:catechol-2,3-dioxygenase